MIKKIVITVEEDFDGKKFTSSMEIEVEKGKNQFVEGFIENLEKQRSAVHECFFLMLSGWDNFHREMKKSEGK